MSATHHTILNLPDQRTATLPKRNYLNNEDGLLSWLFTGDHKRIAMMYLVCTTMSPKSPVMNDGALRLAMPSGPEQSGSDWFPFHAHT